VSTRHSVVVTAETLVRAGGLADVVHQFCDQDVVVDTGKNDPQTCVGQVLEA
jgi:uncharacterized phosphosugar-binding protein